jgi:Conserved TM helix
MDLTAFAASLQTTLGTELPRVMGSIAILILGWLLALVFRAAVRKVLRVLAVNQRIKDSTGASLDAESPIEVASFWFVLLATLVAVLNVMDLQALSMPLSNLMNDVVGYLPHLVAGMVLVLVAWILATVVRALATRALASTTLDEKLSASAGMQPISTHAGNVLFWVVNLMFLPAVLNALRLNGLLEPVSRMVDKALGVVPNGVAAALIAAVGYMVARVLRGLVSSLLMAAGTDRINAQIGLEHSVRLSALAGNLAFIFVFIPSAIAALDALGIEAISRPATAMLTQVLSAVPHVMAAVVILLLTWYLSRFAAGLVSSLLENAGVDSIAQKMGLKQVSSGSARPSRLASGLLVFFAMLFAVSEAADQLGFSQVRGLTAGFIMFAGDIVLGSAILAVGFWLANRAYDALQKSDGQTGSPLAGVARIAILGLLLGMGLRAMGIANDIVQLAFGLTLGAVAVAVAISFGLGGREAAAKLMEHWLSKWRRD